MKCLVVPESNRRLKKEKSHCDKGPSKGPRKQLKEFPMAQQLYK